MKKVITLWYNVDVPETQDTHSLVAFCGNIAQMIKEQIEKKFPIAEFDVAHFKIEDDLKPYRATYHCSFCGKEWANTTILHDIIRTSASCPSCHFMGSMVSCEEIKENNHASCSDGNSL